MTDMNNLKNKISSEKEKMSQMDKAKKRGYIFDYYLKPAVAIAVVCALVIWFFVNMLFGGQEVAFFGAGVNVVISDKGKTELTEGFREYLGLEKETVDFESDMNITFEIEDTDQYAYANRMKLMAQVASGELDYFIMSKEVFEKLSKNDLFLDLSAYSCDAEIVNGKAIVISDTDAAKKLEVDATDGVYLAFLSSSKKQDTIQEYIDFIFE